jgi:hypothetical protein
LQDGINPYWQAFYFSNAKYPLANVTFNGQPLDRNEFQVGCVGGTAHSEDALHSSASSPTAASLLPSVLQFWVHSAPLPSSPVEFVFEAVNGKRVTARCDDPLKEQRLPNFD